MAKQIKVLASQNTSSVMAPHRDDLQSKDNRVKLYNIEKMYTTYTPFPTLLASPTNEMLADHCPSLCTILCNQIDNLIVFLELFEI